MWQLALMLLMTISVVLVLLVVFTWRMRVVVTMMFGFTTIMVVHRIHGWRLRNLGLVHRRP